MVLSMETTLFTGYIYRMVQGSGFHQDNKN
jgi:hypothetical protein